MKPLRKHLNQYAKEVGLRLDTIQQDYILTLLLQEISEHPELGAQLAFKGGTALKKCYFGQYRFSEDLDFTALGAAPQGAELERALQTCCVAIETKLEPYELVKVICERYREQRPHPHDQEAFVIRTQFPWQRQPLTRVMIEITREENLVFTPEKRTLLHPYDTFHNGRVLTYQLAEIVLEKLRAILQHTKKLHERDWSRSRARDYYDLWHILCKQAKCTDLCRTASLLQTKCAPKEVVFEGVHSFFEPVMIAHVKQTWHQWLQPLILELPSVDEVLENLHSEVEHLLDR